MKVDIFINHVTYDRRIYDLNLKLLLQSLGVGQFQESWLKKNIQMAKFTDLKTKIKKQENRDGEKIHGCQGLEGREGWAGGMPRIFRAVRLFCLIL